MILKAIHGSSNSGIDERDGGGKGVAGQQGQLTSNKCTVLSTYYNLTLRMSELGTDDFSSNYLEAGNISLSFATIILYVKVWTKKRIQIGEKSIALHC